MIRLPAAVAVAVVASLSLSACGSRENGTAVAISTDNAGGATGGGEVKIDTPAFKGQFTLPRMNLTAANFDIDGVHLYPGTRIAAVEVGAKDGGAKGDGAVTARFDSPADVATVRAWLVQEFARNGTQVSVQGDRIQGRARDRKFTIDLAAQGPRTDGVVTID